MQQKNNNQIFMNVVIVSHFLMRKIWLKCFTMQDYLDQKPTRAIKLKDKNKVTLNCIANNDLKLCFQG